jgi:type IV pilus assembly protein PilE
MRTTLRTRGFTLIEMMIVVALIGIISAVAYPSYQGQMQRSRRASATACLSEMSNAMERAYTTTMQYPSTLPTLSCTADNSAYYTISLVTASSSTTTYVVQAVPTGPQVKDTKCNTLTLDNRGIKTASGTDTVANCWR